MKRNSLAEANSESADKIVQVLCSVPVDERGNVMMLVAAGLRMRMQFYTAQLFDAIAIQYNRK